MLRTHLTNVVVTEENKRKLPFVGRWKNSKGDNHELIVMFTGLTEGVILYDSAGVRTGNHEGNLLPFTGEGWLPFEGNIYFNSH